jgi:hypothetical protein
MSTVLPSALAASVVMGVAAMPAQAVQFGFDNITNNNSNDAAIGERQLSMDVTDAGTGQASFRFTNVGSARSSITDIYFDDAANPRLLSSISSIFNSSTGSGSQVSFSEGAAPPNLPGGNDPRFSFSADFSADSDAPVQPNGVNPGEALTILFNLTQGTSFNSLIAGLNSGSVRVGLHVQGYQSGGSESFINLSNTPTTEPVPEPMTMLGSGLAIGFGALFQRQRAKKRQETV